MKFRITGSGNSAQVPCFGCGCSACARARTFPEYRRGPCGAEVDVNGKRYLIDAGRMDLVEHCDAVRPEAILLTHYHPDHTQGLLRLRKGVGPAIAVFGPQDSDGFDGLFDKPGILDFREGLTLFQPLSLSEMEVTPVSLNHSKPVIGYCLTGPTTRLAYLTDTQGMPLETERFLSRWRPDILILDATHPPDTLRPQDHNTVTQAVEIAERLQPTQTWLTHLSHEVDAAGLAGALALPAHVSLAHDGLELAL